MPFEDRTGQTLLREAKQTQEGASQLRDQIVNKITAFQLETPGLVTLCVKRAPGEVETQSLPVVTYIGMDAPCRSFLPFLSQFFDTLPMLYENMSPNILTLNSWSQGKPKLRASPITQAL